MADVPRQRSLQRCCNCTCGLNQPLVSCEFINWRSATMDVGLCQPHRCKLAIRYALKFCGDEKQPLIYAKMFKAVLTSQATPTLQQHMMESLQIIYSTRGPTKISFEHYTMGNLSRTNKILLHLLRAPSYPPLSMTPLQVMLPPCSSRLQIIRARSSTRRSTAMETYCQLQ